MSNKKDYFMIWYVGRKKDKKEFISIIETGIIYAKKKYGSSTGEISMNIDNFIRIGSPEILFGYKITPLKSVLINNIHIHLGEK